MDDAIQSVPLRFLPVEDDLMDYVLTTRQTADFLGITPATLRGWISRKQVPPADGNLNGKTPYWRVRTLTEYLRNAPGGRLGYPVG